MKSPRARKFRRALAAATGTTVLMLGGAVPALAGPVSLNLSYQCPFPLLGYQQLELKIDAVLPDDAAVGKLSSAITVHATATVPPRANDGLHLVDAATIEGTATAAATLNYPTDRKIGIALPLTMPVAQLPATGPFDVLAEGKAPRLLFRDPGTASVTVGDFRATLTPKKADGGPTGIGTFTSECTLLPGQNTTLGSFTIAG
ncbi:DUF6801 domain-containing protein [Amycolatopsis nigrescens]|uniref:DUF6801 domain-containing protein n=1 Tax=Amycolatopsis nigrescens TaxID=381445 RepID=UPI00036BCEA9|nr:DUF6801 domain-containing protein [Amycolatopsis nigrescens]